MDLTVWCVKVGDKYSDDDVYRLRAMVARHCGDHQFRCLTDRWVPGVDCEYVPNGLWPGWWSKLLLFRYATGQNLYFDLDTVIVGPVDPLVSEPLTMPKNWALSGHGGWQSSVMSWGRSYPQLWRDFNPRELVRQDTTPPNHGLFRGLWGDQEYITSIMGDDVVPMPGIYSYKYHCRGGAPDDAAVVCFHGDPKPWQVSDPWVVDSRSM